MTALMALRNAHKEEFEKKHAVKLGFMSAFVTVSLCVYLECMCVCERVSVCVCECIYVCVSVCALMYVCV